MSTAAGEESQAEDSAHGRNNLVFSNMSKLDATRDHCLSEAERSAKE
jgi:hypothetical protein